MLRDLSDTARLTAAYRALETERSDPLFRDRLARRLAGAEGRRISDALTAATRHAWVISIRTFLFDRAILEEVGRGIDAVVNLAAGFDSRPYRLPLPAALRWTEVDLPDLLAEKERLLAGERPTCDLRRAPFDLSDAPNRRALLEHLGRQGREVLVLTEGLLIYLAAEEVAALAADLAAVPTFRRWIVDLHSPALLRLLLRSVGRQFEEGGAAFHFAPADGVQFFRPHGWRAVGTRSIREAAVRADRILPRPPLAGDRYPAIDGLVCVLARE